MIDSPYQMAQEAMSDLRVAIHRLLLTGPTTGLKTLKLDVRLASILDQQATKATLQEQPWP